MVVVVVIAVAIMITVAVPPIPVISLLVTVEPGVFAVLVVAFVDPLTVIDILIRAPDVIVAVVWIVDAVVVMFGATGSDQRGRESTSQENKAQKTVPSAHAMLLNTRVQTSTEYEPRELPFVAIPQPSVACLVELALTSQKIDLSSSRSKRREPQLVYQAPGRRASVPQGTVRMLL